MSFKKIYVASKYAGDVSNNVVKAIQYCRYVISKGFMPLASHLFYPQMLDDSVESERALGLSFGLELLRMCDEVWVFGEISSGMKAEIAEAKRIGKDVIRYIDADSFEKEDLKSETGIDEMRKLFDEIVWLYEDEIESLSDEEDRANRFEQISEMKKRFHSIADSVGLPDSVTAYIWKLGNGLYRITVNDIRYRKKLDTARISELNILIECMCEIRNTIKKELGLPVSFQILDRG